MIHMTDAESSRNLKTAEGYYRAMMRRDFLFMASFLHEQVHFISPLAEMHGKEPVVTAARNLSNILYEINIRSRFAAKNEVVFIYDFIFAAPINELRAAVRMEFTDQLISTIELFYDGRPFDTKRDAIFSRRRTPRVS